MHPPQENQRSIAPALVVGILQGLLLWWLFHTSDAAAWPGNDPSWGGALLSFGIVFAPLVYGLSPWTQSRRAWLFVAAFAVLLGASNWQYASHAWAPGSSPWRNEPSLMPVVPIQVLLLFHAVPFLQGYLRTGRWIPAYPALFVDAWQNALRLALAAVFTGIFWLLLWLCGQLFDMIGLPFIRVLLTQIAGFPCLIVCPVFAIGFNLVGSAEKLLAALRQQVLTLLKWLLPMAALVLAAFSLALLLRAPALWAEKQHVIRAVWLLWLAIVTVYLYNAAYQDGSIESPYPTLLGRLLGWSAPLLLLLSGMAAYDLWIRIDTYGLTDLRYWGSLVAIVTLAYSLGYALAGVRAGRWMAGMGSTNVRVALALIALLAASLVPILGPQRLVARSQAHRLAQAEGRAGPEDFMHLRFDLGSDGYADLRRLADDPRTSAGIRTGARLALAVGNAQDRYEFKYTTIPVARASLVAYPAGTAIDEDLRGKILSMLATKLPYRCRNGSAPNDPAQRLDATAAIAGTGDFEGDCAGADAIPVLYIDLDADGSPEAIAFFSYDAAVFERSGWGWNNIGYLQWRDSGQPGHRRTRAELLQLLRNGDYGAVEPRWKILRFGRERLNLALPEDAAHAASAPAPVRQSVR